MLYVKTNYDVFKQIHIVYPQIHIVYHEFFFIDIIYFNFHIVYKKHIVGSSAVSPPLKKKNGNETYFVHEVFYMVDKSSILYSCFVKQSSVQITDMNIINVESH